MQKLNLSIFLFYQLFQFAVKVKRLKKEKIKTRIEEKIIKNKSNKILSEEPKIILNDKNVIDFFYEFNKQNNYDRVKISTSYGEIIIRLFDETPYHKSNFIYLTKLGYFNNTFFHRVVPNFIIQRKLR